MKIPRVGVGIVVIRGEKILMGKRKGALGGGLWAFPGGHLEFGETVEMCAMRELEEETGLRAKGCELGGWGNTFFNPDHHYITLFAYVWDFTGEPELLEPEKCEGWEWFHWKKLPQPYFPTINALFEKGELERFMGCRSLLKSSHWD